jgi:hypothetical protein
MWLDANLLSNIMHALKKIPVITSIDLSNNRIDLESIYIFAEKYSCTHLAKVNLSRNYIDSEGIQYLVNNLKDASIEELDLSYNFISADEIHILSQVLKNTTITFNPKNTTTPSCLPDFSFPFPITDYAQCCDKETNELGEKIENDELLLLFSEMALQASSAPQGSTIIDMNWDWKANKTENDFEVGKQKKMSSSF